MSSQTGGKGVLLKLFWSMLYISTFTFGGGFVIITFMKRKFVDELHWLEESEMLDMTALAQSSPGAIAVNAAILVGWRVHGLSGMAVAVVAKPDDKWGETPCAFVELKAGASTTPEELIAHCRQHLAGFKVPRAIVFGELPKTSTGKIQKFELRKQAGSQTAIDA